MAIWIQNLVVLMLAGACATFVMWQFWRTFYGKRSRVGSCCAKGCGSVAADQTKSQRIVFLPVEMLRPRKR